MNLNKLPKEIQDIIISVYKIGCTDGLLREEINDNIITYLNILLNPKEQECELEIIDSVS